MHRISFGVTEEELALVDLYLRQKRDFGRGPSARAIMARKAFWEYMRRNALTEAQKARAVEELEKRNDPASAVLRRAL
jgi:site-specific recombinase XerD